MPADTPRTYETVVNLLNAQAKTATEPAKMARAALNSGIKDENGRLSMDFRKEPWNDGALLLLNPNPELPASDEQPTKGWLAYNLADAVKRYADRTQTLDGEYLDSLESWGDTLDFRPEHLKTCPYPVPFESDTYAPCVPEWYNVHTFTPIFARRFAEPQQTSVRKYHARAVQCVFGTARCNGNRGNVARRGGKVRARPRFGNELTAHPLREKALFALDERRFRQIHA